MNDQHSISSSKSMQNWISIGDLLLLSSMLITGAVAYSNLTTANTVIAQKVEALEARESKRDIDHDILIRIEEELKQLRASLDRKRMNASGASGSGGG